MYTYVASLGLQGFIDLSDLHFLFTCGAQRISGEPQIWVISLQLRLQVPKVPDPMVELGSGAWLWDFMGTVRKGEGLPARATCDEAWGFSPLTEGVKWDM